MSDTAHLLSRVQMSNAQARDARERWAPHRKRVMAALRQLPLAGARLVLLGAGHLHDVELDELLHTCAHVHLVDLDADCVHAALERHASVGRCTVHAPVDLTGVLDVLPQAAQAHGVRRVIERLVDARCELPGAPFDVVASLGVLTQLMQAVSDARAVVPEIPRLSLAVRDKHLRDLLALTRPGGSLLLVTDFVSTATAPELLGIDEAQLEPQLAHLVEAGNFFTGTNPYRLMALLEEDERFGKQVDDVRFVGPWLWRVTPERAHLTGAIAVRRVR